MPSPTTSELTQAVTPQEQVVLEVGSQQDEEALVPQMSITGENKARMSTRVSQLKFENRDMAEVAADLAKDDLYKGVSTQIFFQKQGSIWKSTIGEFADSSALAKMNDERRPLAGFVSHSWRSSWWKKYVALLLHFYGMPAFLLALAPAAAAMYFIGPSGSMLYFVLFPLFVFAAPQVEALVEPFISLQKLYFFDRCCIVQSPEEKKIKGIYSLDQYLKTSKRLIILYDDDYFTRTWCMFEVATYAYLITEPVSLEQVPSSEMKPIWATGIDLIPVPAVPYFIGIFFWSFCSSAAMAVVGTNNQVVIMLNDYVKLDPQYLGFLAFAVMSFISCLGVIVGTYLCYAKLQKINLDKWSWDDAQCTVPEDKDKVKEMIDELYAEEAQHHETYESGMDVFVKVAVRRRLRQKLNTKHLLVAIAVMLAAGSPLVMIIVIVLMSMKG